MLSFKVISFLVKPYIILPLSLETKKNNTMKSHSLFIIMDIICEEGYPLTSHCHSINLKSLVWHLPFCYSISIWFSHLFFHYTSMQPPNASYICLPLTIMLRRNTKMASINCASLHAYDSFTGILLLPPGGGVYFFTSGIRAGLVNCLDQSDAAEVVLCEFWSLNLKRPCSFHPCSTESWKQHVVKKPVFY